MSAMSAEQDWLLQTNSGNVREFFSEIGVTLPARPGVEAAVSCFANPGAHKRDDRTPSCSVNLITGMWFCQGCGERGNAYKAAQLSGMSDQSAAQLARRFNLFLALEREEKPAVSLPSERVIKKWRHALRAYPALLTRLYEVKGWEPGAVVRLGLGWDGERITFTIRNAKHEKAGIVRYLPGGDPKTKALPGSRRDLFPAPESIRRHHPLFIVEGEPDAVSVWSTGHKVVAVPGAGSWQPAWGQRFYGRERVVVLTDCDLQGRELGRKIARDVPLAKVVDLEPGREDGWDVGDFVREASAEGGLAQASRVLGRLL